MHLVANLSVVEPAEILFCETQPSHRPVQHSPSAC